MKNLDELARLALASIIATLAGCGTGTNVADTYKTAAVTARTEIWKDINSGKAGSATVAVMEDGKVVYAEGFGMADRAGSVAVDPETRFNMGSISKMYCAEAVMLLVDDGKLKLDDPVIQHVPEFKMADERYKKITIRMLLNHTCALPGTSAANNFGHAYNADIYPDTLAAFSRAHLMRNPGELPIYCNDGFTLAEIVVQRVSGMKFMDFVHERICKPLSLRNTYLSIGDVYREDCVRCPTAAAYYDPETGKPLPLECLSVLGAGGLGTTASDLCLFADSFAAGGKQILSKASLEEMKKVQPGTLSGKFRNPYVSFGLGWDVTDLPAYQAKGLTVFGKSGGTGNYTSMIFTVPDRRLSVVVMESGAHAGAMKIALDVLNRVLVAKGLVKEEEAVVSKPLKHEALPAEYAACGGYYYGSQIVKLAPDANNNTVAMTKFEDAVEGPPTTLFYNSGCLRDDSGLSFYLTNVGGKTCVVASMIGLDTIAMEKLETVQNPPALKIDIQGMHWLRRNVKPYESVAFAKSHLVKSTNIKGLPGYIDFAGVAKVQSPEFAGMPAATMRDQAELTLLDKGGATWAWVSDMLYSPADGTAAMRAGDNKLAIGKDGYSQWLRADDDLIVTVQIPAKGRTIAFSPDGSVAYDSAVNQGDFLVKKGGFVEFAAMPGDAFSLKAK